MADNDNMMKPMIALMVVAMMGSVLMGMTPAPVKGHIVVNTTPTGASVLVNGSNIGVSPITVDVDPGTYTILIQLSGYNDATTSVTVSAGETRTLNASLTESGGQWTPIDIIWS